MADGTDPTTQERVLLHELGGLPAAAAGTPRLVVGSRADLEGGLHEPSDFDGLGCRWSPVPGSTSSSTGWRTQCAGARRRAGPRWLRGAPTGARRLPHRAFDDHGTFVVTGRQAERAVALSDLTNPDAADYARQRLKRLGWRRPWPGGRARRDTVRIAAVEFEYLEDGCERPCGSWSRSARRRSPTPPGASTRMRWSSCVPRWPRRAVTATRSSPCHSGAVAAGMAALGLAERLP